MSDDIVPALRAMIERLRADNDQLRALIDDGVDIMTRIAQSGALE